MSRCRGSGYSSYEYNDEYSGGSGDDSSGGLDVILV